MKSRGDSQSVVAVLREITGAAAVAAGLTLISSPGSFGLVSKWKAMEGRNGDIIPVVHHKSFPP